MTPAQRAHALLDGGFLTDDMKLRAVDLGLLQSTDLTPALQTKVANKATLLSQAQAAIATNTAAIAVDRTALAVASPTNAQVVAFVKMLAQRDIDVSLQLNAIIRLILGLLDGTA